MDSRWLRGERPSERGLYPRDPSDAGESGGSPETPPRIFVGRAGKKIVNRQTGEEYMDNPNLVIKAVFDRGGTPVSPPKLRLRLQTLGSPQGYWLDTGILLGS